MDIRPGLSVRIVTDIDVMKERINARASVVHDVQESEIILAQTDPPILKSRLHKELTVTYLTKEEGETVRYGFAAELVDLMDYALSRENHAKALVVRRTGPDKPFNIRMSYRVRPTGHSDISLSVLGTEVTIIDISLGGVRFSYRMPLIVKPDRIVQVGLKIGGKDHALDAHILRTWQEDYEAVRRGLWFASAEFPSMSKALERALSEKMRDIERESRESAAPA